MDKYHAFKISPFFKCWIFVEILFLCIYSLFVKLMIILLNFFINYIFMCILILK